MIRTAQINYLPLISPLPVSICVPAYNEEKNIALILEALIAQQTKDIQIKNIVVVSSGSTDSTEDIASQYVKKDTRIKLIKQKHRRGKAAAINAFLKIVHEPVLVIESADTVPNSDAIEQLCQPFLKNSNIGMTGGAPIPVNDYETLTGYLVHTWWWFHRHIPRFGEIIAFRNILPEISGTTAVDEAYIQAKIVLAGLRAVHVDEAVVRNKGPETLGDLVKQRRRIFNGHSRLMKEEGVKIDHMTASSLRLIARYRPKRLIHYLWLLIGVGLEIFARLLGAYDQYIRNYNPFIWDTATTTKDLALVGDDDEDEEDKIIENIEIEEVQDDFIS